MRFSYATLLLALGAAALNSAAQTPRDVGKAPRIPPAGRLGMPRFLSQVGLPLAATRAAIPADNPQTPEKIELGMKLFFDGRLSADGTVACATCHDPAHAFTDGRPVSIGIKGRTGQRNAPTILNALYNKTQFWDGRVKTLEEQAALPIVNPMEMGQPSLDAAVAKIAIIGEYARRFRKVFGHPPNGPTWCAQLLPTNERRFRSIRPSITLWQAIRTQSTKARSGDGSGNVSARPFSGYQERS